MLVEIVKLMAMPDSIKSTYCIYLTRREIKSEFSSSVKHAWKAQFKSTKIVTETLPTVDRSKNCQNSGWSVDEEDYWLAVFHLDFSCSTLVWVDEGAVRSVDLAEFHHQLISIEMFIKLYQKSIAVIAKKFAKVSLLELKFIWKVNRISAIYSVLQCTCKV